MTHPVMAAALAAISLGLAGAANAYCVYNRADRNADFGSFGKGTNFSKSVPPNGKACCPYNEKTCNHGKKKTSDTQMATTIVTSSTNLGLGTATKGYRCGPMMGQGRAQFSEGLGNGYWLQGSGWAVLEKKNGNYVVQTYNADGGHRETVSCPAY